MGRLDFPKKTKERFFFDFLLFTAIKTDSFFRFLGEFMARKSGYGIIRPLEKSNLASKLIWSKCEVQSHSLQTLSSVKVAKIQKVCRLLNAAIQKLTIVSKFVPASSLGSETVSKPVQC